MTISNSRGPFANALTIAKYNWPFYAAAGCVVMGGLVVSALPFLPIVVRAVALLGTAVAGWFAIASFLASHWVFDRSELTRWRWLVAEFDPAPARWVHINAGLEETNAPLSSFFPGTAGQVLDIYSPEAMSEPAIARARQQKGVQPALSARPGNLPIEESWAEAVFLLMTAHEIRAASERELFFKELARILSPSGKLIVVEHLRDLANALAFGPGVLHFLSRSEWHRLGAVARLTIVHERSFTPFVRVFVYRHASVTAT